ncbi:hypothetical protein DMP13_14195, partial [Gordonibacter urolithinfaciens]
MLALAGAGGPVTFLFWLAALVMFPQGAREATRAFRDDLRVRLVRDRLPFGTLSLLALDSLPGLAVSSAVSCAVVALVLPAGFPLAAGLVLAVLVNAAAVLCCGLDAVRLFPGGPQPFYEAGALVLVAATGALSLADDMRGRYLKVEASALGNTVSSAAYRVVGAGEYDLLRVTTTPQINSSLTQLFTGDEVRARV